MPHAKIVETYYGKLRYITIFKLEIFKLYCKYYFYNQKQCFPRDYASSITRGY